MLTQQDALEFIALFRDRLRRLAIRISKVFKDHAGRMFDQVISKKMDWKKVHLR